MGAEGVIAKVIGAISGALLAITYIQPRSISGLIRRMFVSLGFGYIGGESAYEYAIYMHWMVRGTDALIAATCGVSFFSWWVIGGILRLIAKKASGEG